MTRRLETDLDRPSPAPTPRSFAAPKAFGWNVAAATLLAAALRCFRLGEPSLWIDEILTWYSAAIGEPFAWSRIAENIHGPLHALILHLWGSMAGDSEWALRLPSALFGTAMVPLLALLARRWLGPETAVPAAWLAAGSPFLVWYGQEARNYSLLMLMTVASALLLLRLADGLRTARVLAYFGAAAGGLLSNLSFAFLAPLHLAWWFRVIPRRRLRLGLVTLVALGLALISAPWLQQATAIWDWSRLAPARETRADEPALRGATTFHPAAIPFAVHAFSTGYSYGPSLRELRAGPPEAAARRHALPLAAEALVFGPLAILGLFALRRRGRLAEGLLWLAIPALLVSYVALQNFKVFHPRYLAVAAPGYLLLLAAALADLSPRLRRTAALAIAVLWSVALWNHYVDPRYGKEDVRSAEALIQSQAAPGEQILAVHAVDAMTYYHRGPLPVRPFWLGFVEDPARLDAKLSGALAEATGSWVVLTRPEDLDPSDRFASTIEARYPGADAFRFEGVRVWHIVAGVAPADSAGTGRAPASAPPE